jgi:hypothetical protein
MAPDEVREEFRDSYRTAVAVAEAANRNDGDAADLLFNGSPNKAAVVWFLARLPGVMARAAGADVEKSFRNILNGFAAGTDPAAR